MNIVVRLIFAVLGICFVWILMFGVVSIFALDGQCGISRGGWTFTGFYLFFKTFHLAQIIVIADHVAYWGVACIYANIFTFSAVLGIGVLSIILGGMGRYRLAWIARGATLLFTTVFLYMIAAGLISDGCAGVTRAELVMIGVFNLFAILVTAFSVRPAKAPIE